jgi:hypothetical protein
MHNIIYAICGRQLSCLVQPTEEDLAAFKIMVDEWMDTWVDNFKEAWKPTCMFEYIENQESFSREKKLKYICGVTRMLSDSNYNNYVGCFSSMVKSGEVYTHKAEEAISDDGFHNTTSDRPRCICPPTISGIGPMQAF